jgi:hypothetical protein
MIKRILAGAVGAAVVLAVAPALAGEWRLNEQACPDLREDRADRRDNYRDERSDNGRRDRAEDRRDRRGNRRDEALTICPIEAFYYIPTRGELRRDRYRKIDRRGDGYSRSRRDARPPLHYDRRMRMSYRYDDGRRIYVRL